MFKHMMFCVLGLLALSTTAAQSTPQIATVSGVLENEEGIRENTRVGVHLINETQGGLVEISSTLPVANTFSIGTVDITREHLAPWDNNAILLPGLQHDYSLEPANVLFTRALTNVYVDDGNGKYDDYDTDPLYTGVASLKDPLGFFILIYVDQDVKLSSNNAELNFVKGWNIFTIRFPDSGSPIYAVTRSVSDASLDVFLQTGP